MIIYYSKEKVRTSLYNFLLKLYEKSESKNRKVQEDIFGFGELEEIVSQK